MPDIAEEKTADPEAALPAHITFDTRPRDGDPSQHARASSSRAHSLSRRRSFSRNSIVSSRRSVHTTTPYGGVQIEYRTLSFHVSESRRQDEEPNLKSSTQDKDKDNQDYFANLTYHELSTDQVCQLLNADRTRGLSESSVAIRVERDGKNVLPKPKTNYWKKLAGYVFGGFCSVLWVGAVIFFLCWQPLSNPPSVQNLSLAVLILFVIFFQASFSAFQDWSTNNTMNSILDLVPSDALVLRDSELQRMPSEELVSGDIVHLKVGDKVPADIRLLSHSGDIRFDRSVLTGESEEVEGSVESTDPNFLESRNIALMGTTVMNGNGVGVVILTGPRSVVGRIAHTTIGVKETPSLIQKEIKRFVTIIVCMTIVLALTMLFTWVGWLRVDHPTYLHVPSMLVNVMACIVAFIPEGIPVGVALTLLRVARRMKAVNILPKGLTTVETLGCVNVICSDKTGTLTQGEMFVNSVAFVNRKLDSSDDFHRLLNDDRENPAATAFHRAALLCNDATFEPSSMHLPVAERVIQGNPTDSAIFRFASATPAPNAREQRAFEIPFNSRNKWVLALYDTSDGNSKGREFHAIIKGAPDILLSGCTKFWSAQTNSVQTLTPIARQSFQDIQDELSNNAERVLVLCEKTIRPKSARGTNAFSDEVAQAAKSDLTVIGMLGIIDPPRSEIHSTVEQCRRAGARFFMVTGDYALTAAAIARDIGILSCEGKPDSITDVQNTAATANKAIDDALSGLKRSLLLEGSSLPGLSQEDWDVICAYEEIVFARTTPEQKLRIVTELRDRHNVVAVTGDGVNDAPALRAADVGVAVVTGSDVAIEAADLILLDKFDSIIDAIRLGRLVFQNMQKVIIYLLPAGSWSEIWPVILNIFFGVPLPLSAFLMIVICVFTDLFLSLSLIMEKEEFDLLSLPPRNHRKARLVNLKLYLQAYIVTGFLETTAAHAMYFLYMYRYAGMPIRELFFLFENYREGYRGYTQKELQHFNETGQCAYFVALVFLQWGNIMAVRNRRVSIIQADPVRPARRNPWLLLGMVVSVVIAVFVTEVPGIQRLFGTRSVPVEFWFIPIPLGLGILMIDEIRKLVVRAFPRSVVARIAW